MSRYHLEDKFRQAESGKNSGFLRVTATHQVDLFVGVEEGRRALLLLCGEEPPKVPAFEAIACTARRREDNRWALVVSLERRDLSHLFAYLAEDLVYATEQESDSHRAAATLVDRLKWWQRLLSRGQSGILGNAELRGLVGELLFLRDCAAPAVGTRTAVEGWVGPFEAPRDFRFADMDVEVKAVTRDATTVRISSLEQLQEAGAPVVLCKTAIESAIESDNGAFSVRELVDCVRVLCEPEADIVASLNQRLWAVGYADRDEYRAMHFVAGEPIFFACTEDFPRITPSGVPDGIARCAYEIDLAFIERFKVVTWQQT